MQATQIIYVKCSNYHENVTTDKLNVNAPLVREEVSLMFRQLKVVRSLPALDDFEPSENQAMKKWKWVFTPPPRETQAGEYEVIIPALPRACPGWGVQMTGA